MQIKLGVAIPKACLTAMCLVIDSNDRMRYIKHTTIFCMC